MDPLSDANHGTCMASLIAGADVGAFTPLYQMTLVQYTFRNDGSILRAFQRIANDLASRPNIKRAIINFSHSIGGAKDKNYLDKWVAILRRITRSNRVLIVISAGNTGQVSQYLVTIDLFGSLFN